MKINFIISILFVLACSCKKTTNEYSDTLVSPTAQYQLIGSSQTNIYFQNNIEDQEKLNILTYRNFYNGGGVGIGDINNDGLNDIYFTSNLEKNKLYLNKGDFKFEDITEKAGVGGSKFWSTGIVMADVNADGWLDIYVCNSGDSTGLSRKNELFINNKDLTFTESASIYGLADDGYSTHAVFFDFDGDNDLDCFVLNNSYTDPKRVAVVSRDRNNYGAPGGDRLYRNNGNLTFTDVTKEAGIFSGDIDFGLGVSAGDVNNDGYPDLYISNDFWERDYLYINQKNGTFKEELTDRLSYTSANSMGSDIADLNNDGAMDIFSTDMLPSTNHRLKTAIKFDEYFLEGIKWRNSYFFQFIQNGLQINNGDGTFKEEAYYANVAATDWSWGALIFDMNLDGKKDIFVSNGIYRDITDLDFIDFIADQEAVKKVVTGSNRVDFRDFVKFIPNNKQRNFAFIQKSNLKFSNESDQLGLGMESFSNGSAFGDLDNDGDYDVVVNNVNMPAFIYKNNIENANKKYLKIKLKGPATNPWGLGTSVAIYHHGHLQKMEVMTARGFQSSVDPDLIFGLGDWTSVDSILVSWTDGKWELITKSNTPNQTLTLDYNNAQLNKVVAKITSVAFTQSQNGLQPPFTHVENEYNDFDFERLAPHMMSNDGPKIITGDVNGDKKEDILFLNGMNSTPSLYISNGNTWKLKSDEAITMVGANTEYTAGAFLDTDNDGDLDLLLGCGGNESKRGFESFSMRFLMNDGKGNFSLELVKGPQVNGFVSCIRPHDFNKDGKMDVFIGCKAIPGAYGMSPRPFLLRNAGSNDWVDVTTEALGTQGMINDAQWVDINNDQMTDLVLAGEWMPITIYTNDNGTLSRTKTIPNSSGWWNCISVHDLDGNGYQDMVFGNWGQNMKYQASMERPMKIYLRDFDKNGRPEGLLEWFAPGDDKAYPFHNRHDLTSQMPSLKKNGLKYADFAQKQIKDLFAPEVLSKAIIKTVNNFSSSILWNKGDTLILEALPVQSQLSPVFAIAIADVDGDQLVDILTGGNYYKLKPEVGRLDGNWGGYLKGLGSGKFQFVDHIQSRLNLRGEVRDIKMLGKTVIVGINNGEARVYNTIK